MGHASNHLEPLLPGMGTPDGRKAQRAQAEVALLGFGPPSLPLPRDFPGLLSHGLAWDWKLTFLGKG